MIQALSSPSFFSWERYLPIIMVMLMVHGFSTAYIVTTNPLWENQHNSFQRSRIRQQRRRQLLHRGHYTIQSNYPFSTYTQTRSAISLLSLSSSSSSITNEKVSQSNPNKNYGQSAPLPPPHSKVLLCGDGDLSYSASIAQMYDDKNISLIATVLEEQEVHHSVYTKSRQNTNYINSYQKHHQVLFGVNVTKLTTYFDNQHKFDLIQFNFPHWRGKQNHKYNRELLNSFLCNTSKLLSQNGKIQIALCEGQGGSGAQTRREWRDSWKAAEYAALHGLLLIDVFPFKVTYNLSSHRGMDRSFKIGKQPKMYVFAKPSCLFLPSALKDQDQYQSEKKQYDDLNQNKHVFNNKDNGDDRKGRRESAPVMIAPRHLQLCSRHEIHVALPIPQHCSNDVINEDITPTTRSEHIEDKATSFFSTDEVREIIQNVMPKGIRVEVPIFRMLDGGDSNDSTSIVTISADTENEDNALSPTSSLIDKDSDQSTLPNMAVGVYLVVYCGEQRPMTRLEAEDEMRVKSEQELFKYFLSRPGENKNWLVSKPFPYPLLEGFLKGHRLSHGL